MLRFEGMTSPVPPSLAVVTSLYRSGPYVEEFHARISKAAQEITDRYELVFVNDGSPDDSLERAVRLQEEDPRVVVIDFSRNFGQHKAHMTGLEFTDADYVFLVEVDLEELPEWLGDFYREMASGPDIDVVYGVQKRRKGAWAERVSGALFYAAFNMLSDIPIPPNHTTARLMTRRYVQALTRFRDRELFLGGVYQLVGFQQRPYPVEKLSHSETTYTLRKKLVLLVNAITSFSAAPLTLIFWGGMAVSGASFVFILYVVAQWALMSVRPGWTSLIASIWAVGGLLMLALGVIGIYLKKTLDEVKQRPYSVIRRVYETPRAGDAPPRPRPEE